jgi:PAS domain S-box-containing protein
MSPAPTDAAKSSAAERKKGFLRRQVDRVVTTDRFKFKLLLGAIVGVVVSVVLALGCVIWTYRNQERAEVRADRIEVMRLSVIVENDISALENAYRGHLLSDGGIYLEDIEHLKGRFAKDSEDLNRVLGNSPHQRKQFLKIRNNVQEWLEANLLSQSLLSRSQAAKDLEPDKLVSPDLDEARSVLEEIDREVQFELDQETRGQDSVIRSNRVLTFIGKMDQAASEMQKEMRGYLVSGDPVFANSYKRAAADFTTFQGYLAVVVANEPSDAEQLSQIRERMQRWVAECALPAMAAKREAKDVAAFVPPGQSESRMNEVRRMMEKFEKEQTVLYQTRSAAAADTRFWTVFGIDLFCAIAAGLMIASSCYSYRLCRRQLKKLASADTRMQSVIDQILDGMITINEKGAVFSMNPAAKRMFGYAEGDGFAEDFTQLLPNFFLDASDAPVASEKSHLAQRTGKTTLALACIQGGETTFPVELSLSEMIAGEKKYHVVMVRDITERRRFEEVLAAEKKSLAVTLGSIGDGVITTDLKGQIMVCNPAAETLTGWLEREAVGQSLRSVLKMSAASGPKKKRGSKAGFRNEAESILLTTPERATLKSRDGTERVIEQVASPMRDAKNELCGVVLVFRDITERQRDEAESRKAETLEQLGLLAGGIAHDFNNLLTAIIGNISLAAVLLPPEDPMIVRLDDAKNASLRARDLAQQLLTFSSGGAPIKKTASISKLIEETVSFSLRGSTSRSEIAIEPEIWPAEFDPGQISQVIANLVVNADQAMPEGGTMHVSCSNFSYKEEITPAVPDLLPGDYVRIQVRDEGVGIPEKYLKQIFDPYFTTKPKGSGLGLATTYSVIKNHNGLINVESEPHCGAIFTVYLPAARHQKPPVEAIQPAAPSEEALAGSGRVLIVDDEEPIRDLVDFTLGRLGYEVSAAETALRGIALYRDGLARGRRFDLVILDLTLPGGMGGKEALKRLIEIDPTVNAVVSSGYAMDATMSRSEDFGFRGMIAKPYEAAELGRVVREVIASSRVSYGESYDLQHAC